MIKNLLQEGFILKQKGHYKHAIEVFYKALEIDNTSSELLLEIAELYQLLGNEERALSYIEQVLNKNHAHVEALKLLKKIFLDKKAYAQAEQTAKNIYCITQKPADLANILNLLNKQYKYDEVFDYNVETFSVDIYKEQALAYFYKKEFKKSEELLQKALEIEPDNQEILLILGKACFAQNKKDYCVELAENFTVDVNNAELLNFIGLVKVYCEDYAKATNCFNNAIKLERSESEYYYNLGNAYFKQGKLTLAKKNYNMAISLQPQNNGYRLALANLYYSEKHYKKALEELEGDFLEAKLLKAIILYETGYLALARKEFIALEKEQPDNKKIKEYKTKINHYLGFN